MKEKIATNAFIIIGFLTIIFIGIRMYQEERAFNKCLESVDGTDMECDSCWTVTHSPFKNNKQ